jgi:hypothetical protein
MTSVFFDSAMYKTDFILIFFQERKGVQLESEKLLLRGEEQKFLNSLNWVTERLVSSIQNILTEPL